MLTQALLFIFIITSACVSFDKFYCAADENIERPDYKTLETHFAVDKFQKTLRKEVNELLGVTEMQRIVDSLSFERMTVNESLLQEMAVKLDSEFLKYVVALNDVQNFLTNTCKISDVKCGCFHHEFSGFYIYPSLPECSTVLPHFLKYLEQYGTRVNVSYACCILSQEAKHCEKNFHYGNLTSVFKSNSRLKAVRWQYVANTVGVQLEYPAHVFSFKRRRHWKPFLLSALPFKKRILIVLDTGTVQTEAQLLKLKSISEILLDATAPGDRIMLMADTGFGITTACGVQSFVDALADNIADLSSFVYGLNFKKLRNNYSHAHTLKMGYQFFIKDEKLLRESGSFVAYQNLMFYVSRGVMSDLNETVSVLAALGEIAVQTDIRIKINTIAFSEGGRELMLWSASFLRNIAQQNYTKYKNSFNKKLQDALDTVDLTPPVGETIIVNGSDNSQISLLKMYKLMSDGYSSIGLHNTSNEIRWSHPFIEAQSSMISLSKPVWSVGGLAAVVGMDIILDKFADILRYKDEILMASRDSFLHFALCDHNGRVIIDSSPTRLNLWPLHISELDSWHFEDRYLSDVFASEDVSDGSFKLLKRDVHNSTVEIKYVWMRLKNAPFVLVMAMNALLGSFKFSVPVKANAKEASTLEQLLYHRLGLKHDLTMQRCLHHGAISNFRFGGIFLSYSCFEVQSVMRSSTVEQLYDPRLFLDIGIRSGVKEHVYALWKIVDVWKKVVLKHKNRMIRHYVATSRGVMLTYPATIIRSEYKPTLQPWYNRALKYPGRIVITGPTLDRKLGLVITISSAILEVVSKSIHNSASDRVFAVIAMDMPVGFLLRILRDTVPACKEERRCIVLDDLGYVLARGIETGFPVKELKLSGRTSLADAVEKFHVNHLEPQLATHLIAHPLLVQKGQCIDWKSRSYERFFQFNVTYRDVLTVPCGESGFLLSDRSKGTRAEVISVPKSNVFLISMNENCAFAHQAFCPCSVLDRSCLLCSRFDDTECECPCQCPIFSNRICSRTKRNVSNDLAEFVSHSLFMETPVSDCAEKSATFYSLFSGDSAQFPECFATRCEEYHSLDECLLGIGCQWCATSEDGEGVLEEPYCSGVDQCYGGVKGRQLKDVIAGSTQFPAHWSMATPVGAVAAGIMSVFLIMVMAVYCYRSQVNRFIETRSLTDSFGTPFCPQMPDDDEFQFDYDENLDDKVQLASFEQLSSMRPVVRPQVRPSPRTESSDQGYSTMTDRMGGEESEGASSSINISRRTERTFLMPTATCIAEDCSNSVVVEADVHHVPSLLAIS